MSEKKKQRILMNFLKNQLFFTQKSNNGRWESRGNIRENIFRKIKKIP